MSINPFYIFIFSIITSSFLVDIYVYQGLKVSLKKYKRIIKPIWFGGNILLYCLVVTAFFIKGHSSLRSIIFVIFFISFFTELVYTIFLFIDDSRRLILWLKKIIQRLSPKRKTIENALPDKEATYINRSEFLSKMGLTVTAIPIFAFVNGITNGAHDYVIRKRKLFLKTLPKSFDGMRIVQISDLHTGSILNEKGFKKGIDLILEQKPDMIFVTGDLVNNITEEAKPFAPYLGKLKAPLGVYSILGNHDYGDYYEWTNPNDKVQNFEDMKRLQKEAGWDLLLNENRIININNEKLAVLGSENWGDRNRMRKSGDLEKTLMNTEDIECKLLLTHDPTHWRNHVLNHPSINATFSGHTHGMQFGFYYDHFKWSPSQYIFKEWGGLYNENNQWLYVNVGFGSIGFPGRIGMPPEITVFELRRQA